MKKMVMMDVSAMVQWRVAASSGSAWCAADDGGGGDAWNIYKEDGGERWCVREIAKLIQR